MRNGYCWTAKGVLVGIAILFPLAWMPAPQRDAQADPPKDSGLGAKGKVSGKPAPISGPLRVSKNPNYFEDANGTPLILCGSHSWNTLQDWGTNGSVRPLDFDAFVSFLKAHGHNFTLLWY